MKIEMSDITKDKIQIVKPLWEELNKLHVADSVYWKEYYHAFTFEKRMAFLDKFPSEGIKITLLKSGEKVLGYCISSVFYDIGEIESIYVDPSIQGQHYGETLMSLHKDWLKSKNCEKIIVTISHGHDSVLGFYNKLGFFERRIELELKD